MKEWGPIASDFMYNFNSATLLAVAYPTLINLCGDLEHKMVLDYGSGYGRLAFKLAEKNATILGVDFSKDAVDLGNSEAVQRNWPNVGFKQIDDFGLHFLYDESFDLAILSLVMCNISKDDQIKDILNDITSKLKPCGELLVLEPHPDSVGKEYVSFKASRPERFVSCAQYEVELNGIKGKIVNNWRHLDDYVRLICGAGHEITAVEEPIMTRRTFGWKDELKYPPYLILRSKKSIDSSDSGYKNLN